MTRQCLPYNSTPQNVNTHQDLFSNATRKQWITMLRFSAEANLDHHFSQLNFLWLRISTVQYPPLLAAIKGSDFSFTLISTNDRKYDLIFHINWGIGGIIRNTRKYEIIILPKIWLGFCPLSPSFWNIAVSTEGFLSTRGVRNNGPSTNSVPRSQNTQDDWWYYLGPCGLWVNL
jgi:hypothetical protein